MLNLPSLVSRFHRSFGLFLIIVMLTLPLRWANIATHAEDALKPVEEVRIIYPSEWGSAGTTGLTYVPQLNYFYAFDTASVEQADDNATTVVAFTPYEDLVAEASVPADARNLTFDAGDSRLLLLNADLTELIQVGVDSSGGLTAVTRAAIDQVGLRSAKGMAVDAAGNVLIVLDNEAAQLVRITLTDDLSQVVFEKIALPSELDAANLRAIALNPANRNLYLLHAGQERLYELDPAGEVVAEYDLSTLDLQGGDALAFAPSADTTDDPATIHLFIADNGVLEPEEAQQNFLFELFLSMITGGQGEDEGASAADATVQAAPVDKIVEVTLEPAEPSVSAAATNVTVLGLIRTIQTSAFNPPSPDPSGLEYIASSNTLLISDGEVDEMPNLFENVNLYRVNVSTGNLTGTGSTMSYSQEPVGVAFNPNNGNMFVSDDGRKRVYEVNSSGNVVRSFSTSAFGANDPEGLDFNPASGGTIYIADGTNREVYVVRPGPNGVFDGVDDVVTQFDTAVHGITDPSGVYIDPTNGNVVLVDSNNSPDELFELNSSGGLVNIYDISAANGKRLDGVEKAPSSVDSSVMSFYIVDRGIDNDADPNENDGKMYEFGAPGDPPPPPPGSGDTIYVSSTSGGTVAGIRFANEDVLAYNSGNNTWALYFDGSDVGLASLNLDVFTLLDDLSILLSFSADANIGTLGLVDESDIVRFVPTSIGPTTSGSFQWYFDGSDVGLTESAEDLDAAARLSNGSLLLSTYGNGSVPGLNFRDEQVVRFTPTSLGANTAGTWSLYFDGTNAGLNTTSSEDTDGLWVDEDTGNIYLTTLGAFSVPGVSGDGGDIFICDPVNSNPVRNCNYSLYWDNGAHGFGSEVINALFIDKATTLVSSASIMALSQMEHLAEGDLPNEVEPEDEEPEDEEQFENQLFLPHLAQ